MPDYRPEWCDTYAEGGTLILRCNFPGCMTVFRITQPISLREFVDLAKDHVHE